MCLLCARPALAAPRILVGADPSLPAETRRLTLERMRAELEASGFDVEIVDELPDETETSQPTVEVMGAGGGMTAEVHTFEGEREVRQRVRPVPASTEGGRTLSLRVAELLRAQLIVSDENDDQNSGGSPPLTPDSASDDDASTAEEEGLFVGLGAAALVQQKGLPPTIGPAALVGYVVFPRLALELRGALNFGSEEKKETAEFLHDLVLLGARYDLAQSPVVTPFASAGLGVYHFATEPPDDKPEKESKSSLGPAAAIGSGVRFRFLPRPMSIDLVLRGDVAVFRGSPDLHLEGDPAIDGAALLLQAGAFVELGF